MVRDKAKSRKNERIDQAVKAVLDAKAAEPVPQHLIDLANELDMPPEAKTKAG